MGWLEDSFLVVVEQTENAEERSSVEAAEGIAAAAERKAEELTKPVRTARALQMEVDRVDFGTKTGRVTTTASVQIQKELGCVR